MKSTSGAYFQGLDHIRAVAAFMVFSWHFSHVVKENVPFTYVPLFPTMSLFEEGHAGVALFMVLSGYLFAKILYGKNIIYSSFFINRALRLLPLLIIVIILAGIKKYLIGDSVQEYIISVLKGVVFPTLPNGG